MNISNSYTGPQRVKSDTVQTCSSGWPNLTLSSPSSVSFSFFTSLYTSSSSYTPLISPPSSPTSFLSSSVSDSTYQHFLLLSLLLLLLNYLTVLSEFKLPPPLLSFLPHTSPLFSSATSSLNFLLLSSHSSPLVVLPVISPHFSSCLISHLTSLSLSPLPPVQVMLEHTHWAAVSSLLHNLLLLAFGYKTRNNASQGTKTFRHSACCRHYKLQLYLYDKVTTGILTSCCNISWHRRLPDEAIHI